METPQLARTLIGFGLLLVVVGGVLLLGQRLGLGRLPGDFTLKRPGFTIQAPLATSIIVSLVLTILLNLWVRRR
jgi:hypothetical protein